MFFLFPILFVINCTREVKVDIAVSNANYGSIYIDGKMLSQMQVYHRDGIGNDSLYTLKLSHGVHQLKCVFYDSTQVDTNFVVSSETYIALNMLSKFYDGI